MSMNAPSCIRLFGLVAGLSIAASPAMAQNWSGDARLIAMGGAGTNQNLASKMIEEERGHRTIVLPFGLFQILKDTDIFDPSSDEFDLVRSIEYAASPLHYTVGRDGGGSAVLFVNALRNAELSRDLNTYRGFVPVTQPVAYGLGNPSFGGTIPVYKSGKTKHGVYVGAGPYFAFRGGLAVDEQLVGLLSSDTNVYLPNTQLPVSSEVRGEAALAVTGGYRGRYALPNNLGSGDRDGIYVAFDYHYLRGFRYEEGNVGIRLDTDNAGMLTVNPALPSPIVVSRTLSDRGDGYAMDFGTAVLMNRWEYGFGVNSIANRIKWRDVETVSYSLGNLFTGSDFTESPTATISDVTLKQPVEYTGSVGYHADHWTVMTQAGKRVTDYAGDEGRYSGTVFRAGAEYRFAMFEPRGGVFYVNEIWQPAGGIGVNFGGFGVDGAVYTTSANVQRERRTTFAVSLRIGKRVRS